MLMTSDAVGGVWHYTVDLATALAAEGAEVLVANLGPPTQLAQREELAGSTAVSLVEQEGKLEWMQEPWRDVDRHAEWLLELADQFRPDIIHVSQLCFGGLPWPAPAVMVVHSCVFSWWEAVHGELPPQEWNEYLRRVTESLRRADAVVTPSRALRDRIASLYGVPISRIRVVPNFSAGPVISGAKRQCVLASGRMWDRAKNIRLLRDIAPLLQSPVLIAGDNDEPESASDGRLRLLGRLSRPELASQMAQAAVYGHPALYEPFGLSVLEAARHGCALVLSDLASLRENWEGAALFVPPHDSAAWVTTLNRLRDGPGQAARWGERAAQRAAEFNGAPTVNAYRKIYASLQRDPSQGKIA